MQNAENEHALVAIIAGIIVVTVIAAIIVVAVGALLRVCV